ncbi:SIS domain-containing protein [Phycisphaerales bacterium AB-hyl4]|uniref:SIS domain-containing protein n=1 Tax=Natronomicrosphaera hydrolytica TaxID=3242702 RepID=A0ABV4U785_9BACT
MPTSDIRSTFHTNLADARDLFAAAEQLAPDLERAAAVLRDALLAGNKLLCCGNGGSAADSAHFTAEIAGRYKLERPGYPAIDLTAEHSLVTALINDYPPAQLFARQLHAHGKPGDVLVAFTTSGNSENVRLALQAARERNVHTIAFLGKAGGQCKGLATVELIVPHDTTARIQELHLLLYHTLCEWLDPQLT